MFRTSYNRAVLRIRIDTVTPLLIRAGTVGLDPVGADLACVRTRHAREDLTVYIPGSSLKGVVRSCAESMVRGATFAGVVGACDPLDHKESCGKKAEGFAGSPAKYRAHCLACRTFGSTAMKGRAAIRDLFPWRGISVGDDRDNFDRANAGEIRHGVAINRMSGAVQHGPFDQEMVPAGVSFWGDVALENYQLWQLGLIVQALDALSEGVVQLGSSKSRGLGVVRAQIETVLHEQRPGSRAAAGVAELMPREEVEAYGLLPDAVVAGVSGTPHGLSMRFEAGGKEEVRQWLTAGWRALEVLS